MRAPLAKLCRGSHSPRRGQRHSSSVQVEQHHRTVGLVLPRRQSLCSTDADGLASIGRFFAEQRLFRPQIPAHEAAQKVLSSGVGWSSSSSSLALACMKHRADGRSSRLPRLRSGRATTQDGDGRCVVASWDDIKQLTGGPENPHASPAIKADGSPVGTISERCRRASVDYSVNVTTGLQTRCHPLSVARHVGYARAWNSIGVFRKACEVHAHGESAAGRSDAANDSDASVAVFGGSRRGVS